MGQYLLSLYCKLQIGFLIEYEPTQFIRIDLPFVSINIGLTDSACGIRFFNDYEEKTER
jgi:hypothetical protein